MTPAHKEMLQEFEKSAATAPTVESLMERMANRLHEKMTRPLTVSRRRCSALTV